YQMVYATDASVEDSTVDGAFMTAGDRSGIVIDRCQRIRVAHNTSSNSPIFNILITGSFDVLAEGNIVWGPGSGITAGYNFETGLDPNTNESHRLIIADNIIKTFGANQNGLVIIGV